MLNLQPVPLRFPQDILRFLYWIFFKPITLHRYIYGIDSSFSRIFFGYHPSLYALWKRRKEHIEFLPVIWLSLFWIVFAPILAFPLTWIFQFAGLELNWFSVFTAVVLGIGEGLFFGMIINLSLGSVFALGLSWGLSVLSGRMGGTVQELYLSIPFLAMISLVLGIGTGMMSRNMIQLLSALIAGVLFVSILSGILYGMTGGIIVVVFIIGFLRLPLYLFEAPWAWAQKRLYREKEFFGSPVVWDEMIWFPLPGLDSSLVQIAKRSRQRGLEAIAFVAASFRQGWAAKRALLELIAYDIGNALRLNSIAEISDNLSWLPDDARMDMKDLLLGLEQSSQHARAALESETLYNKQEQLRMALNVIERMRSGLALAQNSDVARKMIPALEGWRTVFNQELVSASGREQIPNVYHSGTPLIKESKTFKGRKDLFRSLSNELINPSGQRPALLLFGARRMGKSSTLKQLPVQLGPQIIPATVDLQSLGAVETASSLLYLIAREIARAARQERRLTLPELTREQMEKDPYLAFQEWLEKIEKTLGDYYWVLLALDEFEALGEMLSSGRIDERIFQTLRGMIQHHSHITVLISGAHTLEELPPLWSNYLINTKMLKVGPLDDADARDLVTRPIENFPLTYDQDAVSFLLHETGCHPNWLQFTCREVVENLNNESRFHASRADVESALNKVPQVLAGDFKDLWEGRDSNDLMRSVLKFVTTAKENMVDEGQLLKHFPKQESDLQNILAYLSRRDILVNENGQYRFNAALLRRWVAKQP